MSKFEFTTKLRDHETMRPNLSRGLVMWWSRSLVVMWCCGLMIVAGCTLIPKYHRPAAPISQTWPKVPGHGKTITKPASVPAADIGWREFFRDARLQALIKLALTNNLDLRIAMLNVQQYRALYHVQRDALVPTVDINANGTRQRSAYGFGGKGSGFTYSQYQVGLGVASYELDLFGRVRSLKQQALETYFATEEAQKTAQITLVAEVAAAYLTERELTEQLGIARQTFKAARSNYDLTKRSYEGGVVSQLALDTAETQLQTARAAVAGYEQQLAQERNSLVLLIGCPLPKDLPSPKPFNPRICLSDLPAGLPSDLIARRPDILGAEHQLKAANANIGAARAAFFPKVTLTGAGGTESTTLESLFGPGTQFWSFSPQIVWPIFAAGTAYHELQAVKAARLIQVANYQKTIQTAFREVADTLAVRATVRTQLAANKALVKSAQDTYKLTEAQFKNGVASSLDVLTTQEAYYKARQNLVQSQYSRLFNLINLYQALGGGWSEHTVHPEQANSH